MEGDDYKIDNDPNAPDWLKRTPKQKADEIVDAEISKTPNDRAMDRLVAQGEIDKNKLKMQAHDTNAAGFTDAINYLSQKGKK